MYAKDYETTPFYFTQTSPAGKVRIACWCCNPHHTWDVAEQVLAEFPQTVAVLLKVEATDDTDQDGLERYHRAGIDKQLVLSTLRKYEDYVLGDTSNELAVRRADTGEYLAYDRAGVLWLYPNDNGDRWCEYLEARGFTLAYRKLISDVFHWGRSATNRDKQRDALILDLALEPAQKAYK